MNRTKVTPANLLMHVQKRVDIILHSLLIAVLLVSGIAGWVNWFVIQATLLGMLVAAAGGIVIGIIALRYLAHNRNNRDIFLGMVITIGTGVITIGYLYIVHIKGPMSGIGTLNRTLEQILIFTEFLIAQISGIKLGRHFIKNDAR